MIELRHLSGDGAGTRALALLVLAGAVAMLVWTFSPTPQPPFHAISNLWKIAGDEGPAGVTVSRQDLIAYLLWADRNHAQADTFRAAAVVLSVVNGALAVLVLVLRMSRKQPD